MVKEPFSLEYIDCDLLYNEHGPLGPNGQLEGAQIKYMLKCNYCHGNMRLFVKKGDKFKCKHCMPHRWYEVISISPFKVKELENYPPGIDD